MTLKFFPDVPTNCDEVVDFLRTRKEVLAEYRTFVRAKTDQMRSIDLSELADTGQALTQSFLQCAWQSYLAVAEEKFGDVAVNRALREIGPF